MPNTAFHPTAPAGFARLRRRVNLNVGHLRKGAYAVQP